MSNVVHVGFFLNKFKMLTKTLLSVSEAAMLIQFPGGEITFFKWLRENKFLQENNQPYEKYKSAGWFVYTAEELSEENKSNFITPVTKVTIKGLYGLQKKIKSFTTPCPPCP